MPFSAPAPIWAYIAGVTGYLAGLVRLSAGLFPSFRMSVSTGGQLFPQLGHSARRPQAFRCVTTSSGAFDLGPDVACTWRRWQPTLVPHGGRDPPALIMGWYNLRHMVSRRRGGCTAGRWKGKREEKGAGALCTILPRLYCKSSIWLFKFNLHPLARNFSPPF